MNCWLPEERVRMGKMGEEEWEVQAFGYRKKKSQG